MEYSGKSCIGLLQQHRSLLAFLRTTIFNLK
uniref:Uncharacterized protein n=1 Tax=Anguilla anguilla TaxID=7936 RepID=A0A0E9XWF5_ANGAN